MKQSDINKLIKQQKNYIDANDQLLHNDGINKIDRLQILKYIMNNLNDKEIKIENVSNQTVVKIVEIFNNVMKILPRSEISQQLFMHFGSKISKESLDQFYTPITISSFINRLVYSNKSYIDPAAGTGDLLIEIDGRPTLWEISGSAIEMAKMNYRMSYKEVDIVETDSLKKSLEGEEYDYTVMNPPFGTKTVTVDKNTLNRYELGEGRPKQELGILFIELGIKLLKPGGILFAVVPGGYLGNNSNKYLREYIIKNTRIISILKLPNGTFSRSGTGVSTYLIILKKEEVVEYNYDIHISEIKNIGYELSKKNTPIKFKLDENNNYVLEDDKLVIDDDFIELSNEIKRFGYDNNIDGIKTEDKEGIEYDKCNISDIMNDKYYVMETGRYIKKYKDVINNFKYYNACKISDLCEPVDCGFAVDNNEMYKYVDISSVNTPLYNYKLMRGLDLPSRAKNRVIKNDIVISKLRGNISYTVILEDNIVVTNGMCILRTKNKTGLYKLLSNIKTEEFKIQHQAYTTGSIMECISDEDIEKILLWKDIDHRDYVKIYKAMATLHELL